MFSPTNSKVKVKLVECVSDELLKETNPAN